MIELTVAVFAEARFAGFHNAMPRPAYFFAACILFPLRRSECLSAAVALPNACCRVQLDLARGRLFPKAVVAALAPLQCVSDAACILAALHSHGLGFASSVCASPGSLALLTAGEAARVAHAPFVCSVVPSRSVMRASWLVLCAAPEELRGEPHCGWFSPPCWPLNEGTGYFYLPVSYLVESCVH